MNKISGSKKRRSSLSIAYAKLRTVKSKNCCAKATKTELNSAKADYISKAVAKGQTKIEATKKANKVLSKACPVVPRKRSSTGTKKTARRTTVKK